ncbi:MAG TPA: DUF2269 family protein [Actinomycetota bacterium]
MTLFEGVKFAHVVSAIVAVGTNLTYGLIMARSANQPEHERFALGVVKTLDRSLANPAYGLLLVTGIWMVFISPYDITDFWILTALVLYAAAVLGGILLYAPILRRQNDLLESEGPASPAYRALADRARAVGIGLTVLVLTIVFLMVTKPTL